MYAPASHSPSAADRDPDRGADTAIALALAVVAAAGLGAMFGPDPWYHALAKPSWAPPASVFGPVWSVLYALIFWAGWRVAGRAASSSSPLARGARVLMSLWWAQLLANALWSVAFVGLRWPVGALAVAGVLFVLLSAFAWRARRIDRWAAALFVPYAAWVAFAGALNAAIVVLNA